MAKKDKQSARTTLEEVNENLTSAAQRIEDNKKYINWALIAIAVLVLLAVGYIYGIRNPNIEDAKNAIGKADLAMIQGQKEEALKQYEMVAKKYSNKFAERAHLNAAVLLYQDGKYDEAIKHLEAYTPNDKLVAPAAKSLLGDCYVNKKQYDKALAAYDKAISLSDKNEEYTPEFMIKKATVLHELKKYDEEIAIYEDIKDNYFTYRQNTGFDAEKYLERAKALAGK